MEICWRGGEQKREIDAVFYVHSLYTQTEYTQPYLSSFFLVYKLLACIFFYLLSSNVASFSFFAKMFFLLHIALATLYKFIEGDITGYNFCETERKVISN